MSHEIWESDAFLTVRKPAWHGLGVVLPDYPSREEAQAIAHPWEPVEEQLYLAEPTIDSTGQPRTVYEEAPGVKAIRRSDNGEFLGTVGDGYVPVKNDEMWDIAEAIQGETSEVKFETAGSLQGGRKVWVLIRLNDPIEIKGDPNGATLPYYSLQNSHNGSGSFRGQATVTRIVCANTAHVADLDAKARGTEFTFRHSKNIGQRIEEARMALAGWRESLEAWKNYAEHMLTLEIDHEGVLEFLERWIPAPPENHRTERVMRNVEAARAQWMEAYNGPTCEGIQGTAYGLAQASSEYAEHMRAAQNEETKFKRSYIDRNAVLASANKLALELAG